MCGICGFVDFNKKTDLRVLRKMNLILSHRGPDGEGYLFNQNEKAFIGLGHRRLKVIDLSEGGFQPQSYKSLHITFNGEIYNYLEIKKKLEAEGHRFSTNSDTEVILHAYDEWGEKALEHFIGMFVIVIFDEKNHRIFIARDRAGVKPLFYYWKDNLFLFGSELKALIQHPEFQKELNVDAAAAFLQYGYVPTPHCIFKNCYKLAPGHHLQIELNDKNIKETRYWNVYDAYNQSVLKLSWQDAVDETERVLTSAFRYRMVSDVPVGVFLSGGYDSTCVTALLQKNSTAKIKTFTIGIPDIKINEAPFAAKIASHLGTDHMEYYCTEKEAIEIIPRIPFFFDEPAADSSAIPAMLVSRIAREKVTVALSADAGDEIFAGYNRYRFAGQFGEALHKIPDFLRKGIACLMHFISADSLPFSGNCYYFSSRYEKIKQVLGNTNEKNILKSLTQQFCNREIRCLFYTEIKNLPTAFDRSDLKKENYSLISLMMAMDFQTYLIDDILQKVDRATMSVGLEGREPFLDQRIIGWAAQLPMEYKHHKGNKKFIIKEIVHRHVPVNLMERPKNGFAIPVKKWLHGDLKQYAEKYLSEDYLRKQDLFNSKTVLQFKKGFYRGKMEWTDKIWNLLMFQMWYDKWLNNVRMLLQFITLTSFMTTAEEFALPIV